MAWQLVEEVLGHCPDLAYRQFRVLVALAFDAKPNTRRCAPGMAEIARQANCRERTAQRALAGLAERKLIKTAIQSAPGRRAVYEILPMPGTGADMVTPVTGADMVAGEQAPIPGQRLPVEPGTPANMVAHPTKVPTEPIYEKAARQKASERPSGRGTGINSSVEGRSDAPPGPAWDGRARLTDPTPGGQMTDQDSGGGDHWPGSGQCQVCRGWYAIRARGEIGRHTGPWQDGYPSGPCPGSGLPAVTPVPCLRCGRDHVYLFSLTGLCKPCTNREAREAQEAREARYR
jgi:hypothetical protein